MEERFPIVGTKLRREVAHEIAERFLDKYHYGPRSKELKFIKAGQELTHSMYVLTWMTFQQPTYIPRDDVERLVLQQESFLTAKMLYIMLWNWGDVVYETPLDQAKDLILNKTALDNEDHYLFPFTMEWCIAYTHDAHILITGQF